MLFRFDNNIDPFDPTNRGRMMLAMDAIRSDDAVTMYLDAPGLDRDDIDLTVERNSVTIEVSRRWFDPDVRTLTSERAQGTFKREIQLGDQLDTEGIEAELAQGVLAITVPVKEGTKPRSIDIRKTESSKPKQLETSTN